MTAHFVARVVESLYNKVDIDKMSEGFDTIKKNFGTNSDEWTNRTISCKQYFRWLSSCYTLERYLQENYTTFEQTELVYRWGKRICEQRNNDLNNWRSTPTHDTFEQWLNKKYK